MLARREQVHQNYLVKHVSGGSPAWTHRFGLMSQRALGALPSLPDAQHKALAQFYRTVHAQAGVLSYIDVLQSLAIFCACMAPLALLMKKPPRGMKAAAH